MNSTTRARRIADVIVRAAPPVQDNRLICIFCDIEAGQESPFCFQCGEYKGIMTVSEARSCGYQINLDEDLA